MRWKPPPAAIPAMPFLQANGYADLCACHARIAYLCGSQGILKPDQIIHRQCQRAARNALQRSFNDIDAIVEAAV